MSTPTDTTPRSRSPKTIQQLAAMELRGTPDVAMYAQAARDICRMLALELDTTAGEIVLRITGVRSRMGRGMGLRNSARKAVRRLRRAASQVDSAADDCARFWVDYLREFQELVRPEQRRDGWNFREDGKTGGNGNRA